MELAIMVAVAAVALAFGYTNGFHDAADAIATSVSTRALTPRAALGMAAVMNFVGAFLGQRVASTVSETIDPGTGAHGLVIVMAGLFGAIAWNLLTWYFGLPSSSSYALIGGLVGAALVAGVVVDWATVIGKVVIPMVLAPLIAFGLGFAVMIVIMWAFRNSSPRRVGAGFRLTQTVSAAAMALGHGLQDAPKTMGVIFLALLAGSYVSPGDPLPLWVTVSAATAISLGTYSGGWRTMRTLGRRTIDLDPPQGFAAETVAASVLCTTAYAFQAPISTSHTTTSAIMGVGATKRVSAVRWGAARSIMVAWALTFPMAGLVAGVWYMLLRHVVQVP